MMKLQIALCLAMKKGPQNDGPLFFVQKRQNGIFKGLWEIPGGKREHGESWKEAAIREFEEEVLKDHSLPQVNAQETFIFPYSYENHKGPQDVLFGTILLDAQLLESSDWEGEWMSFDYALGVPESFPAATVAIFTKLKENPGCFDFLN